MDLLISHHTLALLLFLKTTDSLVLVSSSYDQRIVYLFELPYHQGRFQHIHFDSRYCTDLGEIARKCNSIQLDAPCVRLYNGFNCTGKYIEMNYWSPAEGNLSVWNFENQCRSIGTCPACPLQIPDDQQSAVNVTLYTQKHFQGSDLDITVKGCTQIPTHFHNRTKSVEINGICVQLYENSDCYYGHKVGTIELDPTSPYHEDLHLIWNFPVAKAISRCDYKCMATSFIIPKHGDVFLFKYDNFSGQVYKFSLPNTECIHLPKNWVGFAQSIGLGYNTSVILFDKRNCFGRNETINGSVPNLDDIKFGGRVRSIGNFIHYRSDTTQSIPPYIASITTQMPHRNNNSKPNSETFSPTLIAVVVLVPLAAVMLSVIVVFCVLQHCNHNKNESAKLSEKEIREFISGMGIDLMVNAGGSTRNENDYSTEFLALNNAYNMDYEIPRSNIEIDPSALLGAGEFGMVYKGKFAVTNELGNFPSNSTSKKVTVAIKTVNQTSGLNGLRSLLKEVKVMLYMGQHDNIAKLLGCCTDKIRDGDIMVVLEYCSEGSLESYLKKNRECFNNMVNKGKLEIDGALSSEGTSSTELSKFNTIVMTEWCLEIARGMEFLSNAKVVHSDLAARNILLNDQLVAKISDFGLSRQLYAYSQYMKKQQEPLPFRWMAIESLKNLEFSTKSDVWSYGVLIWEIFSLGEKPYPGLGWNEAFISNLGSGLRLAKPKNSTNDFYNLMLRCWDENPAGRPSFSGIVEEIQEMKAGFSAELYTNL